VTGQYYFELEVLETCLGAGRAFALGFVWGPLCREGGRGLLPESASSLPRSLVLGGEPPLLYLGGLSLGEPRTRRLALPIVAGSVLGVLLEASAGSGEAPATLRLAVFQDGALRAEALQPVLQEQAPWAFVPGARPQGVVDLCGSVRSVRLRDVSRLPPHVPAAAGPLRSRVGGS